MEIEQKERERIEALIGQKWEEVNYQLYSSGGVNPTAFRLGFLSANTHLQKEVIQPLRKSLEDEQATAQHWLTEYKKLEAEIKALREQAKKDFDRINELEDRLEQLGEFEEE